MRTTKLLATILVAGLIVSACRQDPDYVLPAIRVASTELDFSADTEQPLEFTATRDWRVRSKPDWVTVSPDQGSGSESLQRVRISVDTNPNYNRTGEVILSIGLAKASVAISQPGAKGDEANRIAFRNNFDKEVATQAYGTGNAWPYMDQFEGWKNENGTGADAVAYEFASISVRANSKSDSNYSDYAGSGDNNLFLGPVGNFLKISNIKITEKSYTLSFGSEKYLNSGDSKFSHDEFHVYVSDDGTKWVELAYAFPDGDKTGRWDLASSTFSVPDGTAALSLYFKADVASAYRLDDVTLISSDNAGTSIDFTTGISLDNGSGSGGEGGGGGQNTGTVVFQNNFDKEVATQTFGSGSAWPYLDQFEGWKNETGTGAAAVAYEFANISARANSMSNSNYSDYSGSGGNNLFFGPSGNFFRIGNIQLASTSFTLSFGSEKYLNSGDSNFSHSEFHVYVSNDGTKWVELAYAFPGGDKSGRWDQASSTFTVPTGTAALSLYFKSDVASAYRLDDVSLVTSNEAGTSIDFSTGITLDNGTNGGSEGGNGGGNEGGGGSTASGDGTLASPYNAAAAAAAVANLTWTSNTEYDKTDEVYVKGKISKIATKGTYGESGDFGNASYDISEDGTTSGTQFQIYRSLYFGGEKYTSGTDIKVGDEVIIKGKLMNYKGNTPETVANESCLYSLNGKTE